MRVRTVGAILAAAINSATATEPTLEKIDTAVNSLTEACAVMLMASICEGEKYLPTKQANVVFQLYHEIRTAVEARYSRIDYASVARRAGQRADEMEIGRAAVQQGKNDVPELRLCHELPQSMMRIWSAVFLSNPSVKVPLQKQLADEASNSAPLSARNSDHHGC